jgi:hypothetical protein
VSRQISTRAELIDALRLAAELEHGLMVQYLFAAYSLKRYPYEGLSEPDLERVRRWASLITLIARQEMEHLGLALNLLSAVGGTPSFSRPNMPQRLGYYGEARIKLTLTRCDTATIERFQRFEAPDSLTGPGEPDTPAPPVDQHAAEEFCKGQGVGRAEVTAALRGGSPPVAPLGGAPHIDLRYGIPYRSVQELYEAIEHGLRALSASLGERNLFVGRPENQLYGGPSSPQYGTMNDLTQYGLDVIGVTDLPSALRAVLLIVEQGEGIRVKPCYRPHTHFCLFTRIRAEMAEFGLGETAARPVVANPMTVLQPDVGARDEVNLITDANTLRVARLFNECYEVMLFLLLYLYSDRVKTRAQADALMDAAFFPFMTMFVRPLAEILTELPAFDKPSHQAGHAGPGFELAGDVLLFPDLDPARTRDLFQERLDSLVAGFAAVVALGDPWRGLPGQDRGDRSAIQVRLEYLSGCMARLAADWKADWLNVGRTTEV